MADEIPKELLAHASTLRHSTAALSRRLRALRADHGISASKLSVLGWLARARRPLTASELAQLERLQPQSLTRVLAELEEAALIHRHEDASDRRRQLIGVTIKGLELLAEDVRRQTRWLAESMSSKLTGAERDLLLIAAALFDRLTAPEIAPHA